MKNEIIQLTKKIDNKIVSLRCSEALSSQGEFLLSVIEEEQRNKDILKDNYKLQIGWSFYILLRQDDSFKVLTPDYRRNPFEDMTPDVTLALFIQAQQNQLLRKSNVHGEPVSFQDKIVVLKDALTADLVYLERSSDYKQGDSGWYIGLVKDPNNSLRTAKDYQAIYVYQLLQYKPYVLQLLTLPKGSMAIVNGDEIIEVVDENNNKLL